MSTFLLYLTLSLLLAFYFGFVCNEVTYNEAHGNGQHSIQYSPAPGNKTEKSFIFFIHLNALQGGLEVGSNALLIIQQDNGSFLITHDFGDINLFTINYKFFPNDPENHLVDFNVVRDNFIEGQEIAQLQIARSIAFDGFEPLFQNVRIIINDSNSEL